jgi:hypothetical protein
MKVPILGFPIDERFLTHRLKSTSLAGIVSSATAILLWAYHYYIDHELRWELLAIGLTFIAVKFAVLAWYRFND